MLATTAHVAPTVTIPLPRISSQVVFSPRIARRRRRNTGLTSTITIRVLRATDLLVILRVTFWQGLTPLRVSPATTTPSPAIAAVLVVHPAGFRRQRQAINEKCVIMICISHPPLSLSAYVGSLRTIFNIGVGVVVTAFLPALWPPTAHPMANTRRAREEVKEARFFINAFVDLCAAASVMCTWETARMERFPSPHPV